MKYSAASLCLLFPVGQSVSGAVVSDTFDGRTLNAALWAPVFISATGTAAQTNNQLNIVAQGAADNFLTGLRFRGTMAGNFDVQIGFTLNTDIADDGRDLILPITDVGSVSSVSATIPAHGTSRLPQPRFERHPL